MEDHLGYAKHAGKGIGNSRNGKTSKTLLKSLGQIDLAIPRYREGVV